MSGLRAGQRPALPPPPGVEMRADVVYRTGGGRDLTLTLFFPHDARQRPPLPGLIFLHGGGWSAGSPRQFYRQAGSLAAQGIVCASIAYRLSGEANYPAALEDAQAAVRWLRAHARALNVDPKRIGAVGASAGGHLAALLATTAHPTTREENGDLSSRVCLAVLFNPVLDLRDFAATEGFGPRAVRAFLGATPEEAPQRYRDASPLTHVGPDTAPCLLFHGTADTAVPHAQAIRFRDALRQAGVPVELVSAEGQGHGFFNRSPWYEQSYEEMETWLRERFRM